jgi:hypothetical protein
MIRATTGWKFGIALSNSNQFIIGNQACKPANQKTIRSARSSLEETQTDNLPGREREVGQLCALQDMAQLVFRQAPFGSGLILGARHLCRFNVHCHLHHEAE